MLFSTVFLFALWFEPSWLGAGWGPVGEVDAASFRSASLRAQADTQSSEHGVVATGKHYPPIKRLRRKRERMYEQLLLSVIGAFAEFERSLIRERQREGIALAKKAGV